MTAVCKHKYEFVIDRIIEDHQELMKILGISVDSF